MILHRLCARHRRGGTLAFAVAGVVALMITFGVEMDSGRLYTSRHKDQVIADACAMAALTKLPNRPAADTAIGLVQTSYNRSYNPRYSTTVTYTTNGQGLTTGVTVQVSENVPMFIPGLMGNIATRRSAATAAGDVYQPSGFLQGVVPLGLQYNDPNFIPPTPPNQSGSTLVSLKLGSSGTNNQAAPPGNFYGLAFPGSNAGASQWDEYVKLGYNQRIQVGDAYDTEPGNMVGPTNQAIVTDLNSRFNRQSGSPLYANDTWQTFHSGDPRVIIIPLVDWVGQSGGRKPIEIKSFAAFWVESINGGQMTGRFIRYTLNKDGGPAWDGVTVDPSSGQGGGNTGLWYVSLKQ
jgi:hypothetical protein